MTRRLGSGFETNGSLVMLMWWPLAMITFLESMFVIHCWVHTHNTKSYCLCSTDISCISPCSFCISHSNSGSLHWTTPHCTLSDQPTPHRWAKHLHTALVQCSAIVSGVLPNTTLCQTSFTNSFYAFTVIWVHFMYCLLELVCNGLIPVWFMLTFEWCTRNVPCTQTASTQCYLPIPYCVCGPLGMSFVCCEQLEVLLSGPHALCFLARLDSDCSVGSHSSLLHCLCPHSFLLCISGWVTVNILPPLPWYHNLYSYTLLHHTLHRAE